MPRIQLVICHNYRDYTAPRVIVAEQVFWVVIGAQKQQIARARYRAVAEISALQRWFLLGCYTTVRVGELHCCNAARGLNETVSPSRYTQIYEIASYSRHRFCSLPYLFWLLSA